jgi:hypothetical protein
MSCCELTQRFPCRWAIEEVMLEFDFGPILDQFPGAKVDEIKPMQVIVLAGDDEQAAAVLKGPPAASEDGRVVLVPIGEGVPGTTYLFFARVVLDNGVPAAISGYSTTL